MKSYTTQLKDSYDQQMAAMLTQYNEGDLEAQMRVKDVFDPAWLLNPAKVFPLITTRTRREAA